MPDRMVRPRTALLPLALLLGACPLPPNHEAPRQVVPPPSLGMTVEASRPVPPLSGGTLTVLADGHTAVAADPDRDRVFVADLRERTLLADLPLTAGDEPGRSVEDATGTVHLVLRRGGALLSLRPTAGVWSVVARRPVCAAPRGIAYDVRADLLHVACADGALVSLPATGGEAVRTVAMPLDLRDVVVTEGQLLVSRFRSAEVLAVNGDGKVSTGTLPPLEEMGNHSTATVAWRMRPFGTGAAMVHQYALDGEVQVIHGGYGGSVTSCGQLLESAVSVVRPGGGTMVARLRKTVLPIDLAVSPDGHELAVVSAGSAHTGGSNQIVFASQGSSVTSCNSSEDSGSHPQPHGEAVALEYLPDGQLVVQTREPATIEVLGGAVIPLSKESRADTGHAIFHSTAGALLACASCHPEGGEDGHVWTFAGLGARRTQSLRGGISGSAPFHWDGKLAGLPQLYQEVFTNRMAGPALDAGQAQALTRWLDGIPSLPTAEPGDAAARGQALFAAAGCTACHNGPAMTNNLTVDVGTGGAFQTPSLRGVRWRAPFLHGGCAPTLADRFGTCGGDRHGAASSLSAAQIADLVAYLETL
jgi:cytochrome c553